MQCEPQLNCEIQPIVVEGVCFNHTQPLHKGFGLLSLLKGHPCPQNPKKRGYFRYPQNNRPTYIFSHPRNRDFPYLRYINTPMSRISCPSNDNHEKTFFSGFSLLGQSWEICFQKFSQDFHYLDKKPLTWGCSNTLWEVWITRIQKNIFRKVIFGVPEIVPLFGVLGAWRTFKKAEMAKTVRNGLSMIETNPLDHNWLDFSI